MKIVKNTAVTALVLIVSFVIGNYIKNQINDKFVNVYFLKSKNSISMTFVAVKREISPDQSKTRIAISELLKGPTDKERRKGLYTEIPSSTRLLSLTESQDKIVINLSKDFEDGGGSSSLMARVDQLKKTALESAGKKSVYLNLEGQIVDVIGGEGIIIEEPLKKTLSK